ncbi:MULTISPECIES: hypothetical protein [Lysobacter]|uniref:hypothetical protein n=1 Tax=Lysobacter TaxID=68 RepID=UPI001F168AD9|nr:MULTISPECIES: hypothetical protein [Lysobacter]UJB18911.1 hypothetical protein L1A79_21775 [Lysobacter capsici]UJQ27364.1 hypothetical protein L2D09_18110 [Lysobacter gummosus]
MRNRSRVNRRSIRGAAITAIALCVLTSHQASAQMIVKDPFGLMAKLKQTSEDSVEYGKQSKRWQETASQYQKTVNHYQQQLIRLQRLNFGQSHMEDSFPPRPADYGMEDMCPGRGEGIKGQLTTVFQQAAPKLGGNVIGEQQSICQRMVHAENMKYNESVQMLRRLMRRNQEFAQIESQRDSVNDSQGALAANDNEAYRFVARNQLDLDYWQARMKAYEDYIESLKRDQARLAKRALEGNRTGIGGQVIQAVAIKAALGN